jgi:hypothetical protein
VGARTPGVDAFICGVGARTPGVDAFICGVGARTPGMRAFTSGVNEGQAMREGGAAPPAPRRVRS